MKLNSPRQRPLVLAMHLSIAISAPVTAHSAQLIVTDRTAQGAEVDGLTFDTGVATGADGIAMLAASTGAIIGTDVLARSGSDEMVTVMASEGGNINPTGSTISATGTASTAGLAMDGGTLALRDSSVMTTNVDAVSVGAFNGSVTIDGGTVRSTQGNALLSMGADSSITTQGTRIVGNGDGRAVVETAGGGQISLSGGSLEAGGNNGAAALLAAGDGSSISATDVTIEAMGSGTIDTPIAVAVALENGRIVFDRGTATTVGNDAYGVWAQDGGRIEASGNSIATEGARSTGALAFNQGVVVFKDAVIQTHGADAVGMDAAQDGRIEADTTSVTTAGGVAFGLRASNTGTISFKDGNVVTSGDSASGVMAGDGGRVTLAGSDIQTSGYSADGITTASKAVVEGADVSLRTSGDLAYGVYAQDGGSASLTNASIGTQGEGAFGVGAVDPDSRINVTGGSITTSGEGSYAVDALDSGAVAVKGLDITTRGDNAVALSAYGVESRVAAEGSTVVTEGKDSYGVLAVGGQVHVQDSSITTQGEDADGLYATGADGLVEVDRTQVLISGAGSAIGAIATSGGTIRVSNGSRIENAGPTEYNHAVVVSAFDPFLPSATFEATDSTLASTNGAGVVAIGSATVRLANTEITAGRQAIGIESAPRLPNAASTIFVDGGSLHSAEATIGAVSGAGTVNLSNGVAITSDNGRLAQVNPDARLTLNLDSVQTSGDLFASTSGVLDFNLVNGSQLSGQAVNANNATIDAASLWTLTGDSAVASMRNGGTIAFSAPTGGFKQLLVTGDYIGNGGNLVLNTELGGDLSATDKLVVQGNTAGATTISVHQAGGTGAQTTNGIEVVHVDGASDGTFTLGGRVVAGSYEYRLYQGGPATPSDGDWYLRSEALPPPVVPVDPVVPVVPVIPVVPVDPTPVAPDPAPLIPDVPPAPQPAAPLYRPEPAAYLANQAASVGMFEHSMHDRMREPNLGKRGDDGRTSAGWVRVVRNQMDGRTGEDQLDSGTDTSVLQIGGEIARWNDDSRFHLGLMGGTGRANSLVASNLTDYRAKGKVVGYNLGLYGTWFSNAQATTGLYLDGWLQYGRYDNRVQGDYLSEERYDSHTLAASIEAGYAVRLKEGGKTDFYIEPQAQAIFTDYSASAHVENNGTVIDDVEAGGWTTRLGVRFYGHAAGTDANIVQPFATLNWWRDSDRDVMSFNDTALSLELPRDRYEAKLGVQAQLGGGWTGWGNLGLAYGAGDYHDVTGQLGLNYRW
jgi:autotransporter family porin